MATATSATGKTFIKSYEGKGISGYDFQPYYDAGGKPTVGYGHLLTGTAQTTKKNTVIPYATAKSILTANNIQFTDGGNKITITSTTADNLFSTRLSSFETTVKNHMYSSKMTSTQDQFDALVSICFNCGTGQDGVWKSSDMGSLAIWFHY